MNNLEQILTSRREDLMGAIVEMVHREEFLKVLKDTNVNYLTTVYGKQNGIDRKTAITDITSSFNELLSKQRTWWHANDLLNKVKIKMPEISFENYFVNLNWPSDINKEPSWMKFNSNEIFSPEFLFEVILLFGFRLESGIVAHAQSKPDKIYIYQRVTAKK